MAGVENDRPVVSVKVITRLAPPKPQPHRVGSRPSPGGAMVGVPHTRARRGLELESLCAGICHRLRRRVGSRVRADQPTGSAAGGGGDLGRPPILDLPCSGHPTRLERSSQSGRPEASRRSDYTVRDPTLVEDFEHPSIEQGSRLGRRAHRLDVRGYRAPAQPDCYRTECATARRGDFLTNR